MADSQPSSGTNSVMDLTDGGDLLRIQQPALRRRYKIKHKETACNDWKGAQPL
jgi:hypothetical protein